MADTTNSNKNIDDDDLELHKPDETLPPSSSTNETITGDSHNNNSNNNNESIVTTRKRRGRPDASQSEDPKDTIEESTAKRFKKSEDTEETKEAAEPSSKPSVTDNTVPSPVSSKRIDEERRWRVNKMTEDYVELASNMMLIPTNHLGPYGYNDNQQGKGENGIASYPLEHISAFGYLKSPLRCPTVIEKWSPYEISLFEAGMGHFGKDFFQIHKIIQSKSTKEVIDFYYVWKKTSHYKVWKESYVPPGEIVSDDEYGSTPIKKAAR